VNLRVNGISETLEGESSVETLLALKKIDPACVVVELNRIIVKKDCFGSTVLRDGDVVEILRFVGGG
jgi:sulfur carrier protein